MFGDGQRTTRLHVTLLRETAMRGLAREASLLGGQQGVNGLSTAGLAHKGCCLPRQGLLRNREPQQGTAAARCCFRLCARCSGFEKVRLWAGLAAVRPLTDQEACSLSLSLSICKALRL